MAGDLHDPMATSKVRWRNSEAQPPEPPAEEGSEQRPQKLPPSEEEETRLLTPHHLPSTVARGVVGRMPAHEQVSTRTK